MLNKSATLCYERIIPELRYIYLPRLRLFIHLRFFYSKPVCLPAHADPEEWIDNDNVRGGFGDDFSATNTYKSSVYSYCRGRAFTLLVCGIRVRDHSRLLRSGGWSLGGFGVRDSYDEIESRDVVLVLFFAEWETIVVWMGSVVYTDKAEDDLDVLQGLEELARFRFTNDWLCS
ncbi:hypothetical protein EV361DRAFT_186446 [Lentinula raphanica]|uniref:Uncharacterized protein n=1 Tax=Lentinula raphanica TaxID=153919 RepID=A0AA38NVB1_9AGAR|nr:hypothetical protein F5878DRAFT_103108 [Lentinula raphanica]KAJ3963498.1 hypothetical protein EV361DRAFT_186446 [Lentinula raphanica]